MVRKLKLWKAVLLTILGGLVTTILGFLHLGKTSQAQEVSAPSPHDSRCLWDNHWRAGPVAGDTDRDFIKDTEESALRLDPLDPDQNRSRVIDGPELAGMFTGVIGGLPTWQAGQPSPTETVKIDYVQYGVEHCAICGAEVNMGFLKIWNPLKNLTLDIPYIALHYLKHGSFGYGGSVHQGRIDVYALNEVLEDLHLLPVAGDTDGDLLMDQEELDIGTDPADRDENGNFIGDGMDQASIMFEKIDVLPYGPLPDRSYKVDHMVWGQENCEICGHTVNMGFLEVTDPVKGLTVNIPYIGLHYMEHGSFSFDGTVNDGRADVADLHEILKDS
jgi:hypothetical protein